MVVKVINILSFKFTTFKHRRIVEVIMATRQRGGRPRTAGVRPVYEDFKPTSEWQQNDESHTLTIDLPGFMKEQIKVSTEGKNIVRVRGERLVAGNKWSRFLEDFQVPENCEMNSVRAKHQGGNLVITVPKKKIDKDIIAPQTPQEALSPKTTSIDTIPQKSPDKVLPKVSPPIGTSQPTDEKSIALQKQIGDQMDRKSITPLRKAEIIFPQAAERKENSELKEKHIATERQENIPERTVHIGRKNLEKGDKLPEVDTVKEMKIQENIPEMTVDIGRKKLEKSEELPEVETGQKMKIDNDRAAHTFEDKEQRGKQITHSSTADFGAFRMGNYKKAIKGLTELNEERQLLVNMGVAVLVLMALSAYVTYNFASGKAKH